MKYLTLVICFFVISLFYSPQLRALGNTYYVSPSGNDASSGTASSPFKTISQGLSVAGGGDVVLVGDGTYPAFSINRGGNSGAYLTLKAQNKWGAKIQGSGGIGIIFGSAGNYVRLEGFDITGFDSGIYSNQTASHLSIKGNHLHDLGRICTDSAYGLDGVYLHQVSDITLDSNVLNTVGRFANGENGCQNTNGNYQNHDHPVYVDGVNSLTISNNIFYDNTHGWDVHVYSSSGLTTTYLNVVNNTFVGANPYRDGQIILAGDLANASIANNIFYQPRVAAVSVSAATYSSVNLTRNLTTATSMTDTDTSGISDSGNLTSTDPKLVNPGSHDFHLQATSPAIDAGGTYAFITTDLDGLARPVGAAPDIGAYEYQGASQTTLVGDINFDGKVDIFDYNLLVTHFGENNSPADINHDGRVDIFDYNLLVEHFGK